MDADDKKHITYEKIAEILCARVKYCIAQASGEDAEEYARKMDISDIDEYLTGEDISDDGVEPLQHLFYVTKMNAFERFFMYLLVAAEYSEEFLFACARYQGDARALYITPMLAKNIFDSPIDGGDIYCMLSPESVIGRLLGNNGSTGNYLLQPFSLNDRMRYFFFGSELIYPVLAYCMKPWFPGKSMPDVWNREQCEELVSMVKECADRNSRVLCLHGESGSGRRQCLKAVAWKLGIRLVFFDVESLSEEQEEINGCYAALVRECILWSAVPVLCGMEHKSGVELGKRLLQDFGIVLATCTDKPAVREGQDFIYIISMNRQSRGICRQLWMELGRAYPLQKGIHPENMAEKFYLTVGKICEAYEMAQYRASGEGRDTIQQEDLDRSCYALLEDMMNHNAMEIEAKYSFAQLVLPEEQIALLKSACNQRQYQHLVYEEWGFEDIQTYGRGLSMVFYGAPGTGKTMAAQVIAHELGLRLYRVELTTVYSKYIGETEKNLDAIFEQAKRSQIVLFFDEADILFSKRTEIKNSNDKYSNMEAAYLLQKMESYEGITILATNYIDNFDPAFKRRIKFMVKFPMPDMKARKRMWEKLLAGKAPHEEMDYEFLSSFELSGSQIKSIVVDAAFKAAAAEGILSMKVLAQAVREELEKNGALMFPEMFGKYI